MAPDEGQGVPRKHKRKRAEDAEDEAQKVKVTSEKQHAGADPEDHNVAKKTKKKKNRGLLDLNTPVAKSLLFNSAFQLQHLCDPAR